MTKFLALFLHPPILLLCTSCGEETPESNKASKEPDPRYPGYEIIETTPRSKTALTQGILLHEGVYYESTGGYGTSTLREVDPKSGKILKQLSLPKHPFVAC